MKSKKTKFKKGDVLGVKLTSVMSAGYVYAPYIPLELTPIIIEDSQKESELDKIVRTMREETGIIQKQQLEIDFADFEEFEIEDPEDFIDYDDDEFLLDP